MIPLEKDLKNDARCNRAEEKELIEKMGKKAINFLNENSELNFIGIGYTPLQSSGLEATHLFVRERFNKDVNGVIFILPHGVNGYCISKKNFLGDINVIEADELPRNGLLTFFRCFLFYFSNLKKKKDTLFFASAYCRLDWITAIKKIFPSKKIVFIQFDDGTGSYCDLYQDAKRVHKHEPFWKKAPFLAKLRMTKFFEKAMVKKMTNSGCYISFKLFDVSSGAFTLNKDVSEYYAKAFNDYVLPANVDTSVMESCILINTQPFDVGELVKNDIDCLVYKTICSELTKRNPSANIVIKLHPRDSFERYTSIKNVRVLSEQRTSQELLLSKMRVKPKCVISVLSSTLLNAYGIFGVKAISIAKLLLKYNLREGLREMLEEYINQYKDVVLFPESVEELLNMTEDSGG